MIKNHLFQKKKFTSNKDMLITLI